MHTLWSDGNAIPELAFDWYRDNGYDFIVPSDHSFLQFGEEMQANWWKKWIAAGEYKIDSSEAFAPGGRWRIVGKNVAQDQFDRYCKKYGDWVETREKNGVKEVRLKTIAELIMKLNDPGKFLIIPGHEINDSVGDRQLHMNAINVTNTIPFVKTSTIEESIRKTNILLRQHAGQTGNQSLLMVNHPEWVHFSVTPQDLINNRFLVLFENCNADSPPRPIGKYNPKMWHQEKFWDIVTSFRLAQGYPPVYGAATDDSHAYFAPGAIASPGIGWVTVRAESLSIQAIMKALNKGEFYSSTGIELDDLQFEAKERSLFVKVHAEKGVSYKIRFVGTKKGFDQSMVKFDDPAAEGQPARTGYIYSDQIGQTFMEVEGTEATYKMAKEDLYVRAIITSDKKTKVYARNKPENEIGWTQPIGW